MGVCAYIPCSFFCSSYTVVYNVMFSFYFAIPSTWWNIHVSLCKFISYPQGTFLHPLKNKPTWLDGMKVHIVTLTYRIWVEKCCWLVVSSFFFFGFTNIWSILLSIPVNSLEPTNFPYLFIFILKNWSSHGKHHCLFHSSVNNAF